MFRYYNSNPKLNHVEDCTIRAISVAEDISWDNAYVELSESARKLGLMLSSVEAIEYYLDTKYCRVNIDELYVGDFINNHLKGVYLITMPGHITVLKDGINYDLFDSSYRKIWSAWKVK